MTVPLRERLARGAKPKQASPEQQAELDAKLGVTNGEWNMPDTIQLTGKSPKGFTTTLTMTLGEDDFKNPEFLSGLESQFIALGAVVPAPPATRAPAPEGGAPRAPAQQRSGGCYMHGFDYDRAGYQNRGRECGAFSGQHEEWTKDTPARSNGKFYCKSRW